ncbi:MAG: ABC transporter ATP-binding protein [Gomphosphaeria aponina SAG 52.96 = DSM 107014]|uniref:ABC transporter ATP-binding protein n=1 Tax=Gomphosphaeria aponina SAG 52.96 = DSM 107014 TaxID=1521640 RepID=A0A941JSL6_9CHRO|nr:ABC transporter ATP-binding protein [Gomphosphaeria aponina SAG 52.96 = DSM 107014]
MNETLLCVENLQVAYPNMSNWAVNDVSFSLKPGEKLGLVGESGCGKSTLGRAIMQLVPPHTKITGEIKFKGGSVLNLNPIELRQFRGEAVALIFQDPMTRLDPLMSIGEHCLETLKAHQPQLSRREAKEIAIETLTAVKIPPERWRQYPHEFSGGMGQRVAIALALILNPQLIVADEPTTSLDVTVASVILQELTRLCSSRSMALILISHDLAMISKYCDRLGVMYQGKIVETGQAKSILSQPQHEYTKSLLQAAFHLQTTSQQQKTGGEENTPILRVKDLKQHYTLEANLMQQLFSQKTTVIKAVDGVSFDLYPGEIFCLVGESGCGKSTLSRTILQLIKPTGGIVEFQGQDLTKLSPQAMRSKRRDLQMIFQDPHACLNPLMKVGESIADPLYIHQLATRTEGQKLVYQMLERVGLTAEYYNRYPKELSGGQKQRVAIARALITQPSLIICDEPVSMLDANVQTQVLELMLALKKEFNLTYLFITHDLSVARFLGDRLAVMHQGKIVELGTTEAIFTAPQHPYTQKLLQAAPLL